MVYSTMREKTCLRKEEFLTMVSTVKAQCMAASKLLISKLVKRFLNYEIMEALGELLISKLVKRFLNYEIMEALGVIFLQYWLQDKSDKSFLVHLQVTKD
jgi:hypothetical protein